MKDRIKRLLFFVYSLGYLASHRIGKRPSDATDKIIIIQLAKLGDMVCTTPMFRAVKMAYPDCHLTVAGNGINQALLSGHPDIDEYLVWDKKSLWSNIRLIRKGQFDFGCLAGPNFEGLASLVLAGVPKVAVPRVEKGWSPYETRFYRYLREFVITKPHSFGSYAPREYLRLLEPIGIYTDKTEKSLSYSMAAVNFVDNFWNKNKLSTNDFIVGLSPAAANTIKSWPAERFAKVAGYLKAKYQAKIIIFGGPADREKGLAVINQISSSTEVINATGVFDLDQLKNAISRLDLFISVDTGPIYIAEAFSVPTVDIIGPMDEREQPPVGPLHRLVIPKRERAQLHIMNARDYNVDEAKRQIMSIEVKDVLVVVDDLISLIKNESRKEV